MSQDLDFGAKSVQRAHMLKKEYISAPFNFIHVGHIGLDRLDYNNNNTDKRDKTRSVEDFQFNNSNQSDDRMEKRTAKPDVTTKRMHYSKSYPRFKLTKDDISEPFDFMHISHVGLDDIFGDENVKAETIKVIMKEAGVTLSQLEDPGTRKFIIDFFKTHRKSLIEEQEKLQPFERSKPGVSASVRVSGNPSINREERPRLTRHLSFIDQNFNRATDIKPVPPKKPPRLSIRKLQNNHEQL